MLSNEEDSMNKKNKKDSSPLLSDGDHAKAGLIMCFSSQDIDISMNECDEACHP